MIVLLIIILIGTLLFSEVFLEYKPKTTEWNVIRFVTYIIGLLIAITLFGMSVKLIHLN